MKWMRDLQLLDMDFEVDSKTVVDKPMRDKPNSHVKFIKR